MRDLIIQILWTIVDRPPSGGKIGSPMAQRSGWDFMSITTIVPAPFFMWQCHSFPAFLSSLFLHCSLDHVLIFPLFLCNGPLMIFPLISVIWISSNHIALSLADAGLLYLLSFSFLFLSGRQLSCVVFLQRPVADFLGFVGVLLHLHEIVEWLYFYCSLSVCVSLCVCLLFTYEQYSSRTNVPIWTRLSLNGCLPHWH